MTVRRLSIAPHYLSFYMAGTYDADVPLDRQDSGIAATADCINVPCLYWNDGDTEVSIGAADDFAAAGAPVYDGLLNTPHREIIFYDSSLPEIARIAVPDVRTRVRIWTNHPTEPDKVAVAIG